MDTSSVRRGRWNPMPKGSAKTSFATASLTQPRSSSRPSAPPLCWYRQASSAEWSKHVRPNLCEQKEKRPGTCCDPATCETRGEKREEKGGGGVKLVKRQEPGGIAGEGVCVVWSKRLRNKHRWGCHTDPFLFLSIICPCLETYGFRPDNEEPESLCSSFVYPPTPTLSK
ncbi:hypothetical protein LZ31DRAFT_96894 [Colletotrichum somersetense]|nr:hypothetical protein LZ31DRAFT_96894 [Colletotrichum somersetense]